MSPTARSGPYPGPGISTGATVTPTPHATAGPEAHLYTPPVPGLGATSTTSTPLVQLQLDAAAFSAYVARAAAQQQLQHAHSHVAQGLSGHTADHTHVPPFPQSLPPQGQHTQAPELQRLLSQQSEVSYETCDNLDEVHSVCSEVSKPTVDEEAAQKLQDRLQFMEELSSMERYTVYKGRII
jgi:hypothetical protein